MGYKFIWWNPDNTPANFKRGDQLKINTKWKSRWNLQTASSDSMSGKTLWFHIGNIFEATKQNWIRDGYELIPWLDKISHMMEIIKF